MLPGTTHRSSLGPGSALSVHPAPSARVLQRNTVVSPAAPPAPAELPDAATAYELQGGATAVPAFGACAPRRSDIVCADNASCICPLADHVTDAERAVMNDISRQASRLATVLAWLFALAALAAMVLLVLR